MHPSLVDRLRLGDPLALKEALHLHGEGIYAFLLRLSGRRDVAQDLFQETWLALAQHATRLTADTRIEAWLYTVARNAFRSHRRWAWIDLSHLVVEEQAALVPSETPSPEEQTTATQTAAYLDTALGMLRHGDRELLLLSAIDGLSPSEIASILCFSPETMRQRLLRARKSLAEALELAQKERRETR